MSDPAAALQGLVAMGPTRKPLLLCLTGGLGEHLQQQEVLVRACFRVLPTVEEAARTLRHMWRYSENLRAIYETPELLAEVTERVLSQRVNDLIVGVRRTGRHLSADETKEVLAVYGIRTFDARAPA